MRNTDSFFLKCIIIIQYVLPLNLKKIRGRHGRDGVGVGFTTTCAISAYHH
jgi:hypothetical protein